MLVAETREHARKGRLGSVPVFEFVVEGPAVSLRASKKSRQSRQHYQKWVRFVREAAEKEWHTNDKPTGSDVEVTLSNYYTEAPPDVDNIIKPILDALKGLVYRDDVQVHKVTSQKFDLPRDTIENSGVLLARALARHTEVLHIVVVWEE
jgi:crossover junction endodeoxyribonuclease RusA